MRGHKEKTTGKQVMRRLGRGYLVVVAMPVLLLFFAGEAWAGDLGLKKKMQSDLYQSLGAVFKLQGQPDDQTRKLEIGRLKALADQIRANHRLLEKDFERRTEFIESLGPKAKQRHQRMLAEYRTFMSGLEDLLSAEDLSTENLKGIQILLSRSVPRRNRPIYGTLPYKNLHWPAREPEMEPVVVPVYQGGDQQEMPEDLSGTPEAPLTLEIANKAESLDWDPAKIYDWVMNNVENEWYWGCMKGAEETLRQKSGNDCDQAALLVALLRASGYPARYVRGVIEFFPDVDKAKNITGVDDVMELAAFFQKAGIPYRPVVSGGRIENFQVEHVWVATRVPYSNYRGAVIDEQGKTWLALDTSIKAAGYEYSEPQEIPPEVPLSEIREYYLQADRPETPLEFLSAEIEVVLDQLQTGATYQDLLRARTQKSENLKILPASLQFRQVVATHEYHSIPDELLHKAKFVATDLNGGVMFDVTLDVIKLSNRSIAMWYEPETVEDQEIINSFGGLDNTPAYLVRLRPVLKVDGERLAVGLDGLPMGEEANLSVDLVAPSGLERLSNTLIIGNLSVMGLVAGKALEPEEMPAEQKNAERLLHEETLRYLDRWYQGEEELASLMGLSVARPLPSLVTMGGVIEVTYLLDMPHGYEWRGVFVDADKRAVEVTGPADGRLLFMQLSALQGSVLEDRVLREDFQVDSISTARLFGIANASSIPILTIDGSNVGVVLDGLPFGENVKQDIASAVGQGMVVRVPDRAMAFEDWSGVGYLKENPVTGEAGWMLSGMVAGGLTVWGWPRWDEYLLAMLRNPSSEPPNQDPNAAVLIVKVPSTDWKRATVGETVVLEARVFDAEYRFVQGSPVTFEVKAGCGSLNRQGPVPTGPDGIARVSLTLGLQTACNPSFWWEEGYYYSEQVGQNIVDAWVSPEVSLSSPFVAIGKPNMSRVRLRKKYDAEHWGRILTFAGCIEVEVVDDNDNPVSNVAIDFLAGDVSGGPTGPCVVEDDRPALLVAWNDPCIESGYPMYGECENAAMSIRDYSSPTGASVCVFLGGTDSGTYPISAIIEEQEGVGFDPLEDGIEVFDIFAGGSRLSDYYYSTIIRVETDSSMGIEGYRTIRAGKVGTTIPVAVRMYFLKQGIVDSPEPFGPYCCEDENTGSCTGEYYCNLCYDWYYSIDTNPLTEAECPEYQGSRIYYFAWLYPDEPRLFDQFEYIGDGEYLGDGYFTKDVEVIPGINIIWLTARGCTNESYVAYCPAPCQADYSLLSREQTTYNNEIKTIRFYGVDIVPEDDDLVIPVDANGYALQDTELRFEIQPAEYNPTFAYVTIIMDNNPILYIPVVLDDTPVKSVRISRGTSFNTLSSYKAQVVLNPGSNEIKSDYINIHVVYLDVDIDSNNDNVIADDDDTFEDLAPGKIILFNGDDDNENGTPDIDDGSVENEDDLVEIRLSFSTGTLPDGSQFVLDEVGENRNLRIWDSETKDDEINLPFIFYVGMPAEDVPPNTNIFETIYAEGIEPGESMLSFDLFSSSGEPYCEICRDEISLTVIKVDIESIVFLGDHGYVDSNLNLLNDNNYDWSNDGQLYEEPEWIRQPRRNNPITLTMTKDISNIISANVFLNIEPAGIDFIIEGNGTDPNSNLDIINFESQISQSSNEGTNIVDVLSTNELPDFITTISTIINWKFVIQGDESKPSFAINKTGPHKAYITFGTPHGGMITEKRVSWACNVCGGRREIHDITLAANAQITTNIPPDFEGHTGILPSGMDTIWRMLEPDGAGSCEAHANLLAHIVNILGVPGGLVLRVYMSDVENYDQQNFYMCHGVLCTVVLIEGERNDYYFNYFEGSFGLEGIYYPGAYGDGDSYFFTKKALHNNYVASGERFVNMSYGEEVIRYWDRHGNEYSNPFDIAPEDCIRPK